MRSRSARAEQSTAEAVLITDADAKILAVNKAFTVMTGYAEKEVLGMSASILKSGRHDRRSSTRPCGRHSYNTENGRVKFRVDVKMQRFFQSGRLSVLFETMTESSRIMLVCSPTLATSKSLRKNFIIWHITMR